MLDTYSQIKSYFKKEDENILNVISNEKLKEFCQTKEILVKIYDTKCINNKKNIHKDSCSIVRHLLFDLW